MTDVGAITLETELVEADAARDIATAVSARHSIARKYVMRLRRRHPDATPAELVAILERHYGTTISTAGAVIAAGAIAVDVGIALIPVAGAAAAGAKTAGKQAAKKAGKETAKVAAKEAAKAAAKGAALDTARTGAKRVAAMLPASDQQLQFEITAIFGLALADIHGMQLDQDQAHALVYGLSNGRVSQQQIASMAVDVADASDGRVEGSGEDTGGVGGVVDVGHRIAGGRSDWTHWASTLADALPAGAAQSLVQTIQTGRLDTVREGLSGKQQASIEYGVGALAGGVTRFLFGREVIEAARVAFPPPPDEFPAHLAVPAMPDADDADVERNRALVALEDTAKATGGWITGAAGTVGGSAATAASAVTRPFRSVDLDGDGVPDEPQALTAVKGVGERAAQLLTPKRAGRLAGRRRPADDETP